MNTSRHSLWSQLADADKAPYLASAINGTMAPTIIKGKPITGTITPLMSTSDTGTSLSPLFGGGIASNTTPPPTYLAGLNVSAANRYSLWSQLSDADKARYLKPLSTTYTPPISGSTVVGAQNIE